MMVEAFEAMTVPSPLLLAMETRSIWELGAFFALYPMLRYAPRGDGHPVLVLPGLAAGDLSTRPLRTLLRDLGYPAHGCQLGRNCGPGDGVEAAIEARLDEIARRYQSKVSVIGCSLGGIFAHELAHRHPELVRQVITLGSPFAHDTKAANTWLLYERFSRSKGNDWPDRQAMKLPPSVPSTAIYSRTDGVVAWSGCRELESAATDNIEIDGSHCGLGHNPVALYVIADRLSQAEDAWRPFDRDKFPAR